MNRLIPNHFLRATAASTELDRWIQDFWRASPTPFGFFPSGEGAPSMNVQETAEAFEVELELPGLALGDVEVVLEGRDLSLRGERKTGLPEGSTWQRRERFHGKFARTIRLPVDIDAGRVSASLHLGVLRVTCPKSEAAKARRIQVQATQPAPTAQ
jgi:HSP20 family protein